MILLRSMQAVITTNYLYSASMTFDMIVHLHLTLNWNLQLWC